MPRDAGVVDFVPVLEQTRMRALPLLNKSAELAPAATACCGACRTCVTTNLLTAAAAGAAALVAYARRRFRLA